jgi:hypothetical protein
LPVLAELPELAGVLGELVAADRAALRAIAGLARLLADDEVVTVSGVSVEEWVGIVARHTKMDRRLLLRTARLLHRFPTLRAAVGDQQLSWPQLRGLSLVLRDCPTVLDGKVDGFLARLLPHLEGTDPDAVIDQTRRAIGEWTAELAPEVDEGPARNHLHLQPRLDGTGGRISGELDAVGLAIVDDATAPTRGQLDHPGGVGGARADNLLARLTHSCVPTVEPTTAADRHAEDADTPEHAPPDGRRPTRPPPATPAELTGRWAVKLLLRAELSDLLDATRTPPDLLTRLVGGQLRLTSPARPAGCSTNAARSCAPLRDALDEPRELLEVADLDHVVDVPRVARRDRVAGVPELDRFGVEPVDVPGALARSCSTQALACR